MAFAQVALLATQFKLLQHPVTGCCHLLNANH